jgi:predicted nuclease with TOPRIM domain
MINGVTLNMEMPVKDAEGNEVLLYVESETEDLVGKEAYLVDAEGNQTAAANGDYTDVNGRVIKVVDGLVSEVVEAEAKMHEEEKKKENEVSVEELNAKIEELTNINNSLNEQLNSIKAEKEQTENTFNNFKAEFETLKKVVIGKGKEFQASEQTFVKENANDSTFGSWALNKIKSKN